jgi:hypothetical protein
VTPFTDDGLRGRISENSEFLQVYLYHLSIRPTEERQMLVRYYCSINGKIVLLLTADCYNREC